MTPFGYFLTEAALILLIGGMVFFPLVVAPTVFSVLDADAGGRFLRALFPRYYVFIIGASIFGGVGAVLIQSTDTTSLVFAFVATTTAWVLFWLVPRLNAWRDAMTAGDAAAGKKFNTGHRISVIINMIQLVALIAVAATR